MVELGEMHLVPLDVILEERLPTFLDSNMDAGDQTLKWVWELYDVKKYEKINEEAIAIQIENVKRFNGWLSLNHTFVTDGVRTELKRLENILVGKIKYLNEVENSTPVRIKKKRWKGGEKYHLQKELLETIANEYRISGQTAGHSLFKPEGEENQRAYAQLKNLAKIVSKITGAKISFNEKYNNVPKNKREDTYADEELVAGGLYHSFVKQQPSVILTRDSDHQRILRFTLNFLSQTSLFNGSEFIKQYEKEPSQIFYLNSKDDVSELFDSSNFESFNCNLSDETVNKIERESPKYMSNGNFLDIK